MKKLPTVKSDLGCRCARHCGERRLAEPAIPRLLMKFVKTAGLELRPSPINGRGCFASRQYEPGRKIGAMVGELIGVGAALRRNAGRRRIRCVDLDGRLALDSSRIGN